MSVYTKCTVYGDGTVKLPVEFLEHMGLTEGGAVYIAKGVTTKDGEPHPEAKCVFMSSARDLEAIAPEEVGHGLARAAALVSTEREAEVALVSAGYTATEVDRLIAATSEDGRYDGCTFRRRIEGASPRATLDGARDVLAGIDRGARANPSGPVPMRLVATLAPDGTVLRPWLDVAVMGWPDYPRTLTGYLSTSERHVGAAVVASMSGAEAWESTFAKGAARSRAVHS